MWLINSSIGRKVVMSVTGIALVLFLTFHASMNVVALISAEGYNMICEFLGANWYAVVATLGLAALVALHFIYAIWLTLQNRKARGNNRYAVTDKPAMVEWSSQNMLVLGIIVILGMGLHLYNFWYNMMYAELVHDPEMIAMATNGVYHIAMTFSCPVYTAIYMVWLAALWFHLNHGIWSSMQTMGWSGHIWFCRWKVIGTIYTTVIILMFAAVALAFAFGYVPCDMQAPACGGCLLG
ncbi:MAG: succinate dehydrogenase/fumarate reductase cytochrome b subunit [Bacteroidaceae bacterium]|nr:succinate dehydrogenase/fumarate reductase cytochrome b subunit [Bacteroidaceae bacterium]